MKKNDNIEDLFKDSFENFEADVKPKTWDNIQAALKGAGIGVIIKTLINKIGTNTIIAVVSSAATVVGTIMIMNWTGTGAKKETAESSSIHKNTTPVVEEKKTDALTTTSTNLQNNKIETTEIKTDNSFSSKTTDEHLNSSGNKKSEKELKKMVAEIESKSVASINSNAVAGAVPLIVNLSNKGSGKINKWNFGDGTTAKNIANPIHVYDIPGIYTVHLTSTTVDGVIKHDSLKIEVYGNSSLSDIPSSFTPNDDGDNDFFIINSKDIKTMNASIFEGNGTIVYSNKGSLEIKWDGRNKKGEKAKEGLYYYVVDAEGIDGKKIEKKGSIKLTR
ncbi:MAG: gliding motility-associated C-terminal domain-containing protein [Bacteroidia bacterium]|nr:gliding motility-associated C-terminal domain-containing protein [Bacteroidia bacterium]